jgi:hypothetical protein
MYTTAEHIFYTVTYKNVNILWRNSGIMVEKMWRNIKKKKTLIRSFHVPQEGFSVKEA